MIGIRIGGKLAEVYRDTKVSLELVNPLFNEDNLSPGSLSYPFDLPAGEESPLNSVLLGLPAVIENVEGYRKINGDLLFDDIPYKSGKLIVRGRGSSKNSISVNMNFGVRAKFGDDFKNKKLADLVAEAIPIWSPFSHSPSVVKEVYLAPGPAAVTPYEITVNGRQYSNATLSGLASDITADTTDPRATATYHASGSTPLGMSSPYIKIIPHTNSLNPLQPLSVFLEGNGAINSAAKWRCHAFDPTEYNDVYRDFYADNFDDTRFSFPYVKNDSPYGEPVNPIYFTPAYAGFGSYAGGTKITNDVNKAVGGVLVMNDPNFGHTNNRPFLVSNVNSLQPFIRMRHVLNKIKDYFGFEYEGDFIDSQEIDEMFLWNSAPLDVAMDFIGTKKFVFYRSGFDLKELVPDITVRELFIALQSRYNLLVYVNERNGNLIIRKREVFAKTRTFKDITALCGSIDGQEDLRVTGFRMVCERETSNDIHSKDQIEIGIPEGDDLKVFCKAFSAMLASQKIGSRFGLQIFYMRTPTEGGSGSGSPNPLTGAWTETLEGIDGIHEKFWKYWLNFQGRRRSIILPVKWSFRELQDLDWTLKERFDRNDYLVKKIKVEIGSSNDISVSNVELYSMF